MRTRDSLALLAAALIVTASFVIVRLPLPAAAPAEPARLTPAIVVAETGAGRDCPDESVDG